MAKKCPPGKYYCFDDKKCKKIPRGYHIGARGYLARDNRTDADDGGEDSNGNGNGGNGNGNGGGDGGGDGGGGMGESIVYEGSNPRIPRKKGQPANSKKHSDLYTDENPKGTIQGLGFKDVAKAKTSVSKIRNSSRSHAHKIQAAVAMEQRAREMGKSSEAAVYRKYINSMKKKTKKMNEGMNNHPEFALITVAVDELEKGLMNLGAITYSSVDELMQGIAKRNSISPTLLHNQFKTKHLTIPDDWAIRKRMNKARGIGEATMTSSQKRKDTMLKKKYDDSDMKKNMQKQYGKEEGKKVYFATIRKQSMKKEEYVDEGIGDFIKRIGANLKKPRAKLNTIPDDPRLKDIEKDPDLKKMDKVKNLPSNPQRKHGMGIVKNETGVKGGNVIDAKDRFKKEDIDKYSIGEEGLRAWFGKSSGTTKSGRKVKGWVQVGGKYDGKPCARQPGQKSTPKCTSSSKRSSMSDKERDSAARRKRAADPNQPQKSGAAKPTNVSTDPKKKMKENYFNRNKVVEGFKGTADLSHMQTPKQKKAADERLKKANQMSYREQKKKDTKESFVNEKKKVEIKLNPKKKIGVKVTDIGAGGKEYVRKDTMNETKELKKAKINFTTTKKGGKTIYKVNKNDEADAQKSMKNDPKYILGKTRVKPVTEAKDKKGKGSGSKDACYHKVKSRYSVWPSAYASGALVKCRKVGAANWGNSTKKEGFSPMQVAALEVAGMIEIKEGQKCWKGYEKKGTKMMFGKRYNNCVKKKATKEEVEIQEMGNPSMDINPDKFKKVQKQAKIRKVAENPGTKGEGQAAQNVIKDKTQLPKLESFAPVSEGVMTLMRKKEEKKKSKPSVSKYVSQRDAGKEAKIKMLKKDQLKVNFLEPAYESKTRLVKNGHTYKVILTWRGKTYMVQMFVPSVSRPTRQEIEKEVQKLYPDAKVMSFLPRDLEPGEPTVMMGEGKKVKRDEYGDPINPDGSYAGKKNEDKNPKDEKITRSEEYVTEDDMKGMSVSSGHKRPTKSGAGMTAKGVAAYRRRNPGSKLKTAVTGKVKKGSKDAGRRKSYCARSAGQMKKFPKAAKDPNSRLRQARRRWKC